MIQKLIRVSEEPIIFCWWTPIHSTLKFLITKITLTHSKAPAFKLPKWSVKKGAEVLLTGYCGPNAFKAMKAAKIGVANDAAGTVRDAVKAYMDGKLPLADEANAEGQW